MVEQGTHKPLVGSSNLPPGSLYMAWVYILRGSSGQHYIGSTPDLGARLTQRRRGHTHTTKRISDFQVVAQRGYSTLKEAPDTKRFLKAKKESRPRHSLFAVVEQPRELSGLVGSSNLLPGTFNYRLWIADCELIGR